MRHHTGAVNTYGLGAVSDYSEGPTMPTANFEHVNGPYDGCSLPVEVDENGVPAERYVFGDLTDTDLRRDPTRMSLADTASSFYERDVRMTPDGVEYVFRFAGQDIYRHDQRRAA